MYAAIDLSKYIVSKCIKDESPISNLQLQKILYYIQKDFLKEDRLAFGDDIEAWQFGPVVPNVYYRYCGFGAMPITISMGEYSINISDKKWIDSIIDAKRSVAPWDLVKETHKTGGAWDKVFSGGSGNRKVIPVELIKAEV